VVTRDDILRTAGELISGERQQVYGDAQESHQRIADMWTAYLGTPVSAVDVAACMILLKVSRSAGPKKKLDNWHDICGYGALAGEMEGD
tara:strand:+ start:439 stop:705 length:267 start_codon:yes stop_codon:yes gene_type:complete